MKIKTNKKITAILLSYVLIVVDIIIGVLLVPFLLKALGDYDYGIYKLLVSTASYLSVLDFGIGSTITRYVLKFKTALQKKEEENFVAMGLIIYGVLSLAVFVFALVVCFLIPTMYESSIRPEDMRYAQSIFMILCTTTAIQLFNHAYNGLFAAYERFTYSKSINILKVCLRVVLIIAVFKFSKSAMLLAAIDLALAILILVSNILYTKFSVKLKIKLHKWDAVLAKKASIFTIAILGQTIINQFNSNANNIILGIFSTASSITMYSIALQLFSMYSSLSSSVSTVFLPSISRRVFQGEDDRSITESVIEPSRLQLIVLLLALSGFFLFGKDFILLWVGEGYDLVYYLTCVLFASATLELSQNSITSVLKAKNKLHGKTAILGISTAISVLITVICVYFFDVVGAVIGTAVSMIFGYVIALNIYYHKVIKIDMKLYYKETYRGILPAFLLCLIPGIIINILIPQVSIISFVLKAGLYCIAYGVIMLFVGANKKEKAKLLKIFRR